MSAYWDKLTAAFDELEPASAALPASYSEGYGANHGKCLLSMAISLKRIADAGALEATGASWIDDPGEGACTTDRETRA